MKDMPKYGRKGSIVSVARGKMRNIWWPNIMAEYVAASQLKKIPLSERILERDVTFRPDLAETKPKPEIDLLSPTYTVSLLESFLPPTLQFSRPTVAPNETTIHGSISTSDLAVAVRAIASANGDQGSRIVITPDMIAFTDEGVDGDKVKTLGEHQFRIRFRGAKDDVKRKLVIAQQVAFD